MTKPKTTTRIKTADDLRQAMLAGQTLHHGLLSKCLDLALQSKDPNTGVGALITDRSGRILVSGWNRLPPGIEETEERMSDRPWKLDNIVHAEMVCITEAARLGISVSGCTLYLTATDKLGNVWGGCPCTGCTKHMIACGISCIVSRPIKSVPSRWHADIAEARKRLDEAGKTYIEVAYI